AVVLDAFVAAATERARDVDQGRRIAGRSRVGGRVLVLRGEEQPLGPRVPGRAVDVGERRTGRVGRGEQRHAVRRIRVEVDPREVAGRAGLVPLEQEVRAVVVGWVGTAEAVPEDEVRVLVRLGLVRLVRQRRGRDHLGIAGAVHDVVVVPVVGDLRRRVLELRRALCYGDL